MDDIGAALFN